MRKALVVVRVCRFFELYLFKRTKTINALDNYDFSMGIIPFTIKEIQLNDFKILPKPRKVYLFQES